MGREVKGRTGRSGPVNDVGNGFEPHDGNVEEIRDEGDGGALHVLGTGAIFAEKAHVDLSAIEGASRAADAFLEGEADAEVLGASGREGTLAVLVESLQWDAAVVAAEFRRKVGIANGTSALAKATGGTSGDDDIGLDVLAHRIG